MNFGIATFLTDESLGPVEMATMVEENGFESIWLPEHTHIPVKRETPWPAGPELPPEYRRPLDPFVALAAIAITTTRIKIGTAVALVAQHDPIVLAKTIASVDLLSGGRLQLGVGAGWLVEEMRNHGIDPRTRFGVLREKVEAMRAIWGEEEASYAGRHVTFDPVFSYPKPVQPGGPPILVGGDGPRAEQRVLRYGDGWMPMLDPEREDELLARAVALRARTEAGERPFSISLFMAPARAEKLERYRQAGVDRCIFYVGPGSADKTADRLERITAVTATL